MPWALLLHLVMSVFYFGNNELLASDLVADSILCVVGCACPGSSWNATGVTHVVLWQVSNVWRPTSSVR